MQGSYRLGIRMPTASMCDCSFLSELSDTDAGQECMWTYRITRQAAGSVPCVHAVPQIGRMGHKYSKTILPKIE